MSDSNDVCRFCLKVTPSSKCSALGATVIDKIQLFAPDLKLTSIPKSVICNTCNESVEEAYKLIRTCGSSNKLIRFLKNFSGLKNPVDLKELLKGSSKRQESLLQAGSHVCRICLKSNDCPYTSLGDVRTEFQLILKSCVSALDESLTSKPVICKLCTDLLRNMCAFVNELTSVENKIMSYTTESPDDDLDLFKILDFVVADEENVEDQNEPEMTCEKVDNKKGKLPEEKANSQCSEQENSKIDCNNKERDEKMQESCKNANSETDKSLEQESGAMECDDEEDIEEQEEEMQNSSSCVEGKNETDPEKLPPYNFSPTAFYIPHKYANSIEDWMKRVEEIKSNQKWSDNIAKCKVLEMLKSTPDLHKWFKSVADVLSWEQFKEKIIYSFPEKDDYYINLMKLTKRRKKMNETFVKYYHDKLAVMEPFQLTDKQKVSCLLGGVQHFTTKCIGRMGRYNTPEELLVYFKSCDDKNSVQFCKTPSKLEDEEISPAPPTVPLKELIVKLENKKLDEAQSNNFSAAQVPKADQKCSCCDQKGHFATNCPMIKSKTPKTPQKQKIPATASSSGKKIIVHENKLVSKSFTDQNVMPKKESAVEQSKVMPKVTDGQKTIKTNQAQKCACCDKVGHSSMDCPLIREKSEIGKKPVSSSEVRTGANNESNLAELKCSFCDKIGHSSLVCPSIDVHTSPPRRSNIRIKLDKDKLEKNNLASEKAHDPAKEDLVVEKVQTVLKKPEKCSCCDKVGHTNLNCPLISISKNKANNPSKGTIQKPEKCSSCDKIGHTSSNCPVVSVRKNTARDGKKGVTQKSELCSSCNKVGHASAKCSLIGGRKNTAGDGNKDKCSCCNKVGHVSLNCPLIGINKNTTNDRNKGVIQKSEKSCFSCNKVGHVRANCPLTGIGKNNTANNRNKDNCSCCNKVGHASADCPLIDVYKNVAIERNKDTTKKTEKCSSCDTVGHISSNCPLNIMFLRCTYCNRYKHTAENCWHAKKAAKTGSDMQTKPKQDKCAGCDQVGHSLANCPNVKTKKIADAHQSSSKVTAENFNSDANKMKRTCLCCNQKGHSSLDCPLLSINKSNSKDTRYVPENVAVSAQKCSFCNKNDHVVDNCPFYDFFNKSDLSTSETVSHRISEAKERKQRMSGNPYSGMEGEPPEKRSRGNSLFCYDCNTSGHSETNCPRNQPEEGDPSVCWENAASSSGFPVLRCDFCHKVGHRLSECFFARFDRSYYQESFTGGSSKGRTKQCLFCGKFGHEQPDCPKYKPPEKRLNASGWRPFRP